MRTSYPPVVVGVDGRPAALHAVAWAAREADRRGLALRLVAAVPEDAADPMTAARQAHAALAAGRRAALASAAVVTATEVATGGPAGVLARRSHLATLVVIGSDGREPDPAVPGDVGSALVDDAACPVVVVPAHCDVERHLGEVVVAVDPAAPEAQRHSELAVAADVARRWQRPLLVVVVLPGAHAPGDVAAARRVFDAWPEDVGAGVTVHEVLAHGDPAAELLGLLGPWTGLVVLGVPGRGPDGDAVVGRAVLRHARCPVAVVPTALAPLTAPAPTATVGSPA